MRLSLTSLFQYFAGSATAPPPAPPQPNLPTDRFSSGIKSVIAHGGFKSSVDQSTLTALAGVIAALESNEPIGDRLRASIEKQLADIDCPAALPWFKRAVEQGVRSEDLNVIRQTLITSAESTAYANAATVVETAALEKRELTDAETGSVAQGLRFAVELRAKLIGATTAKDITDALDDPAAMRTLLAQAKPSSSSLVATRASVPAKPDAPNRSVLQTVFAIADKVGGYHSYEIEGLENIPKTGPCIVAFNHSLATYDIVLFAKECYRERERPLRMLGDHLIFKTPGLAQFAKLCGVVDGRPAPARALVDDGQLVGVAPGGMLEALRPTSQAYELMWDQRRGFAKMAFESGTPVVLAACPTADDIFYVYENPLTKLAYEYAKIPVPVFTGRWGVTPLPKPAPLKHKLSKPIVPPPIPPASKPGDKAYDAALGKFHRELVDTMNVLMADALPEGALKPGAIRPQLPATAGASS